MNPADGRAEAESALATARSAIEEIDRALIALLARRVLAARQVGDAKRVLGLPTLDPAREAEVVRRAGLLAREAGIDDEDVRYVFWQVIGMSRRAQLQSR